MSRTKVVAAEPDPQYAPGLIRASTDPVHTAVRSFEARHPEYERLGHDVVLQAMSTYHTPEEEEEQEKLAAEGVPLGWRRDADNDDETLESLGRF